MEIGFLLLKILRFYVFKMAANVGRHFERYIKTEIITTQFISQKHTHLTNVSSVYYANIHLLGLFYKFCTAIRHYLKHQYPL